MLREIRMSGIKGQNATQRLTGRDIIIGPNGSGKTTRMQAMSLAALGYVPERGKTLESTFELASEDAMSVCLVTDRVEVVREYKKSSKLNANGATDVKISQSITLSPNMGETTIKQKEQRIKEELGDFPTMLDFSSFIELTDIKKRDFIYNLSGDQFTWDKERIAQHLRDAVLREELYQNNPEMYEIMEKNYDETMKQFSANADVQSGLLAMSEHAKEKLSYWKKEKNNADAAVRKLTELKNRSSETDRNIAENQEKLKAMGEEKDKLTNELAQIKAHNQIVDQKIESLEKIQAELERLTSDTNTEAKMEELRITIDKGSELLKECDDDIKAEQKKTEVLTENREDLLRRIQEKKAYLVKIEAEKTAYNATIKSNNELIDSITQNQGYCAFSKDIPCGHDFSEFIMSRQNLIDDLYELVDNIDMDKGIHEEELAKMEEEASNLKIDITTSQMAVSKGLDAKNSLLDKMHQAREELRNLENLSPIIATKTAQKEEIQAWLDENPKKDVDIHGGQINDVIGKMELLTATIDEQKKIRNDIINIKANIIDSKTAAYEQECWHQIAMAIGQKGIQGDMVKEMLDPLRKLVDDKLQGMGMNHRFYFETESDRGKEIFRFGWIDRGAKRPFNALSQGEMLMLLIALMTTIIERSNPPIKILAIDNINHLDKKNLQRVIEGLNEAGKNMDNIILAGTPELTEADAPNWTVWNLADDERW